MIWFSVLSGDQTMYSKLPTNLTLLCVQSRSNLGFGPFGAALEQDRITCKQNGHIRELM